MKSDLQFLRRVYGLFLTLYPSAYRKEYGEELQTIFNLSLDDVSTKGRFEVARLMFRECISLPKAIFLEYLRERRKNQMIKKFDSNFDFPIGSRSELFAFFIPFIVTIGLFTLGSLLPPIVGSIIRLTMLGAMFILFVVGFSKGLPRWFLPYLGFIVAIVNIFATLGLIDPKWRGFSFPVYMPRFAADFFQGGVFWVGIIVLVFLCIVLAALIPTFHPFYKRLRDDWTLLAFIFYGITPFAILLTFDDYRNAEPYMYTSFLILAIGGRLYLRSTISWKKYSYLFIGLTSAMAVTVLGAAVLIEDSLYIFSTWQTAMVETIMTWMYLALFMLLPPAIHLLPRSKTYLQTT